MSLLDGILSQLSGHGLDGLAARVGLTPEQVQMALQALGRAAPQPGDTADQAAAETGLPVGPLQQILAHLGGEGELSKITAALGGDSGGGLGGMLGGLLGGQR